MTETDETLQSESETESIERTLFGRTLSDSKTRRWQLAQTGHLCDCKFLLRPMNYVENAVSGENNNDIWIHFTCHKMVLATASEVFERMLYGELRENSIRIEDVTADVFEHFLKYVYTYELDVVHINTKQCHKLFDMGYKYMMQDLIDRCVKLLRDRNIWIITDILPTYQLACIYENLPLMLICYEKIQNNFTHILQHESLFALDLMQLKRLVVLLSQDQKRSLLAILKALEAYAHYHDLRHATRDDNDDRYRGLLELKSIARILDFRKRQITPIPKSFLLIP